ncbi:hypothetical protein CRUP_033348, partial [Coryphaenoides rupestris]
MVVSTMVKSEIVSPEQDKPMADKAGKTVKLKVKVKRKAESEPEAEAESCSPKKPKTVNDGFCVFIGNLNKTKSYDELKTSLGNYLMTQSLLVQDIRLDINRVSKAKLKEEKIKKKKKRVKATAEMKAAKFSKWLSVTNLPHNSTKSEIMGIFNTAEDVIFAFVEFKTVADAKEAMEMAQGTKILKKEIQVGYCKSKFRPVVDEVLLTTLIVMGLAETTSEETLKTVFEGSAGARIIRDKKTALSKGFGFVDFAGKEACQAAKESMEDCEIDGKKVTVAYAKVQITSAKPKAKDQQDAAKPGDQPAAEQANSRSEAEPEAKAKTTQDEAKPS